MTFKIAPGLISTNSLEPKEVPQINFETPSGDAREYLIALKESLEAQNTGYTKFKDFFSKSDYRKLIDSVDQAINGYSDDEDRNLLFLKDVKNKANAYLDNKLPKNDTSDLAYRRVNAVLDVLDKVGSSIQSFANEEPDFERSFEDNPYVNTDLEVNNINVSRISLEDALDNEGDLINDDMDDYENDAPQIKKNDVGLDK